MNRDLALAYLKSWLASPMGQAVLAAARVFAATMLGCWLAAGSPVLPSLDQLADWLSVAGPSSLSLVITNYLGPWEKRYGRKSKNRQ